MYYFCIIKMQFLWLFLFDFFRGRVLGWGNIEVGSSSSFQAHTVSRACFRVLHLTLGHSVASTYSGDVLDMAHHHHL